MHRCNWYRITKHLSSFDSTTCIKHVDLFRRWCKNDILSDRSDCGLHPAAFLWFSSASCSQLPKSGSFPSNFSANPTWNPWCWKVSSTLNSAELIFDSCPAGRQFCPRSISIFLRQAPPRPASFWWSSEIDFESSRSCEFRRSCVGAVSLCRPPAAVGPRSIRSWTRTPDCPATWHVQSLTHSPSTSRESWVTSPDSESSWPRQWRRIFGVCLAGAECGSRPRLTPRNVGAASSCSAFSQVRERLISQQACVSRGSRTLFFSPASLLAVGCPWRKAPPQPTWIWMETTWF